MAGRAPFTRHRDVGKSTDEWGLTRAADYLAHAYGWKPVDLEAGVTDEQLIAYLDSAQDRITADAERSFDDAVEAVRIGTVAAHQKDFYRKWRNRPKRVKQQSLSDAALESAIMNIAKMFPDNVQVVPA